MILCCRMSVCPLQRKCKASAVFDEVYKHLDMSESDYFGLYYLDNSMRVSRAHCGCTACSVCMCVCCQWVYVSWCVDYTSLLTSQLEGNWQQEKYTRKATRCETRDLRSSAEFQPFESPTPVMILPYVHIGILEMKSNGWIGGSCGWNSTLVHRPQIRAQGLGSFSPVPLSFKLWRYVANLHYGCILCLCAHMYVYTVYCVRVHTHVYTKASLKPITTKGPCLLSTKGCR